MTALSHGGVEAFILASEIASLALTDPCAVRAWELDLGGLPLLASKIRRCATVQGATALYCRQRLCPGCAAYAALRRAREIVYCRRSKE